VAQQKQKNLYKEVRPKRETNSQTYETEINSNGNMLPRKDHARPYITIK
jgi:hypothetical protein